MAEAVAVAAAEAVVRTEPWRQRRHLLLSRSTTKHFFLILLLVVVIVCVCVPRGAPLTRADIYNTANDAEPPLRPTPSLCVSVLRSLFVLVVNFAAACIDFASAYTHTDTRKHTNLFCFCFCMFVFGLSSCAL